MNSRPRWFAKPRNIVSLIIGLLLVWGGYRAWFAPKSTERELATATRGTVVEQVSVTGNTAPVHSLGLAFESGGTIATVNFNVGAHVGSGSVLVRLNTSDLQAQLAQAQANVDTQTAKLRSLQAGSRPEDIAASEAALAKAKQDLANMYDDIPDTLADGYAKANDAVRNQLSPFFTAAETSNPQLTFTLSDSQTLNNTQTARVQAGAELSAWQNELTTASSTSSPTVLEATLQAGTAHLSVVKNLLIIAAQALVQQTSLSSSTLNSYKTAVTTALSELNSATTNVSGLAQSIASQKLTIVQLQAQLNLKLAGSTTEDIAAQQAQVEQAQASAASIEVKIAKASLVSPISGVVTQQDAKVGEIASPGAVLASIISDQGLEVNANIPEADIGKVSVGDAASMTLDAFPSKTFSGKVSYVEPGEKVIEGVPTYKTTFAFEGFGPEVKPGMTANIDVVADKHENVIYVPQRAVITKDSRRTVMVYHGEKEPLEERVVTVGLRDFDGNVEIVSGLAEGEVVLRNGTN